MRSQSKEIQSFSENIVVGLRIKPTDIQDRVFSVLDEKTIRFKSTNENFIFDHVFPEASESDEIFQKQLMPVVDRFISGVNGAICAYGQTSSGKTFTMKGSQKSPGIIPLALQHIFQKKESIKDTVVCLKVSYLELYNEIIYDLLSSQRQSIVEIRDTPKGPQLSDMISESVQSIDEFYEVYNKGEEQRTVGETKLNEFSSRSHVLLIINYESRLQKHPYTSFTSQLYLVDLAGSEGVSKTQAQGLRRKEGFMINKSLLALQNVVKQLKDNQSKQKFVNFRDSKLTRILQNALSGNSLTAFLLTINQLSENLQESINTIRFGMAAGAIKNTVKSVIIEEDFTSIEIKNDFLREIETIKEEKEQIEEEKNYLIMQAEQQKIFIEELEKQMRNLKNQLEIEKQNNQFLQNNNLQLEEENRKLEQCQEGLGQINQTLSDKLQQYKKDIQKEILKNESLTNASTQTSEKFVGWEQYQLLLGENQQKENIIQKLRTENEIFQNKMKATSVQFNKEKSDIRDIVDIARSPLKVINRQQTYQQDMMQTYLTKSLKKHTDHLETLENNMSLLTELMQKSEIQHRLEMILISRDKQVESLTQEVFDLKERIQILKYPQDSDKSKQQTLLNQTFFSFTSVQRQQNKNTTYVNFNCYKKLTKGEKKKIQNSPSKEELKRRLFKLEEQSVLFRNEIERYRSCINQKLEEKEKLVLFSNFMYRKLVENKLIPGEQN